MRLLSLILLAILLACPVVAQQPMSLGISPFEPAGTGGLRLIDTALVKLSSHRRLLVVGAHPDDEDTALLALVGSGLAGEAAYLSLSRGEGGQNLIGTELGIGLGLIRTGELAAARQVEGTRQYFTRAYDFGYTRSLDETFDRWPRAVLLEDAVRIVRRFKPQVIVAVFPSDSRAGHGQHQAAGVLAEDMFERAGTPDLYPAMTAAGLPPWQPRALFRRAWWNPEEATLEFGLDRIEPFSGHSVLQIAGASRSKHRSQDMGTLQRLGSRQGGLIWVAGESAETAQEIFGGIDTSLAAIADLLPTGRLQDEIREGLSRVSELATVSRDSLTSSRVTRSIPALSQILRILNELLASVSGPAAGPSSAVVADLLVEKRDVAGLALAAAAGVAVDAVADREGVGVGDSFQVTATFWNSGDQVVVVDDVRITTHEEWQVQDQGSVEGEQELSGLAQWGFEVRVPVGAGPTVPYFLTRPLVGDLYDWSEGRPEEIGEPARQAPVSAIFDLEIAGAPVRISREVVHQIRDQAVGEIRRPIRALPEIEVRLVPSLLLWPSGDHRPREVDVLLQSRVQQPIRGRLELTSDSPFWAPVVREFRIEEPSGQVTLRIELIPPSARTTGSLELTATAILQTGRVYAAGYPLVAYPHIRPVPMPEPARTSVRNLDLDLPDLDRVGYVRGASDRVPEVLRQIGLPLEMLTADDLRGADLAVFDAIVVGSRAYETDPILSEINGRLVEYVEQGGLLIVQYQQYQFVRGGFAPFALEIDRPHGRVTDESARVDLLQPDHPVFATPNRIASEDWSGWVQERGLYFASSWAPEFTPLLALQDEGQPLEKGSLLVAELGEGWYVYTGLSFFRQLPAGVPGAIRLFVNLLSLGKS